MVDDSELLRRYAEHRAQDAFAELVQRHLALVYSIATRQCGGDAHLAEDVAQRVFTDVARKAQALAGHPALSGWLCRCTHYAATDRVRAERRRRRREETAFSMANVNQPDAPEWDRVRPLLDDVLAGLRDVDRAALALRFFERHPFAAVGEKLRVSEESARKRVERALEKVRAALARKGVHSTAAALVFAFEQHAVVAVPAGLGATITGAAIQAAPAASGVVAITAAKLVAAWPVAAIFGGIALISYDVHQRSALTAELERLNANARAVTTLRTENERLQRLAAEADSWRADDAEFARLTRQIAVLQARRTAPPPLVTGEAAAIFPLSAADELVRVRLPDADLTTVFSAVEIYSGRKIVRDASVPRIARPTTLIEGPLPKRKVLMDLVNALRQQAGIVVEPLPDGRLLAKAVK